ncbi:hypothetical protein S245_049270, partial [Arachis hypogaea]
MKNSKNKKKNRRRKEQQTSSSLKEASELNNKEINGHNIRPQTDGANGVSEASQSNTEDSTFVSREFDDGDIDEEIDPALQEKLDREDAGTVVIGARKKSNAFYIQWKQFFKTKC